MPDDRTCHLDRGYDTTVTRRLLEELGFEGEIARKGVPAPVQAGTRWLAERTHAWMNGYGKLRRCPGTLVTTTLAKLGKEFPPVTAVSFCLGGREAAGPYSRRRTPGP